MAVRKHWMLLLTTLFTIIIEGQSQRPQYQDTNYYPCDCQYHVTCAAQLEKITSLCEMPGGVTGVCCPPIGDGNTGGSPKPAEILPSFLRQRTPPEKLKSKIYSNKVDAACKQAVEDVEKMDEIEEELVKEGQFLKRGTPASNHLRQFRTGPQVAEISKKALTLATASTYMGEDLLLSNCTSSEWLLELDVHDSNLSDMCPEYPKCCKPNSKYRTIDGSCNNIDNPEWGMKDTALWRLLPPKYGDCIMTPRVNSVTGRPLPNVRRLSTKILTDKDRPDPRLTLSVMQWAQFMDHDFSLSPFPELETGVSVEGEGIECCKDGNKLYPKDSPKLHPKCFPIEIPRDDEFFSQKGVTCMNFVRSELAEDHDCRFGYQEQVNVLTHWLDGSTVYGSDQNVAKEVRFFQDGLLNTSMNNFLPEDPEAAECDAPNRIGPLGQRGICFLAGESRVNEQPGLAIMHTIWLRQHNRIAKKLQKINPWWSDETVYQETRRIIIAQIAHITYNEWLPIIIGDSFMTSYRLSPLRSGFSFDYDETLNANINNEFSTAAYRFGHSLVQGLIQLFSARGDVESIELRDNFLTANLISVPTNFDRFIRGLTKQPPQTFDNHVTVDLTNHLLQTPPSTFGMDLMSLNIQRGRDHAIGTYNEARELCGFKKAKKFSDLNDFISNTRIQRLQKLYESVDDIDLFVGGMSENYEFGAILGPTFLCIVGDQFARLKIADRYFYEEGGQAGSFSLEQLDEIRLTSWARILCDNSDYLDEMQPLAFRFADNVVNPLVPCISPTIPQLNLYPWQASEEDEEDEEDEDVCEDEEEEEEEEEEKEEEEKEEEEKGEEYYRRIL